MTPAKTKFTSASGGCQPSGTLRFRPFRNIESQSTGKLTHAARHQHRPAIQARRADTSSAGGVSHRNAAARNTKAQRADTIQSHISVCRPSGPLLMSGPQSGALRPRQWLCRPSRPESHSIPGHRLSWMFTTVLHSKTTRRADAQPLAGGMFAS